MSEASHTPSDLLSGYCQPSSDILEVIHASLPHQETVNETGKRMILVLNQTYAPLERLAAPFLRLAGVRIDPRNHSRRDSQNGASIMLYGIGYDLVNIEDGAQIHVALPANANVTSPDWSADGKQFVFKNITADSVEVWIGNGQTGAVQRVPDARLNPMFNNDLQWMPDQKTLLVKLVPEQMGAPPSKLMVPTGPSIQDSNDKIGNVNTYNVRDTLTCQHDEDVFDYYAASQLAFIDTNTLEIQPVGKVNCYTRLYAAPDGEHLLVKAIRKPYSYATTHENFPYDVKVWNVSDRSKISTRLIAENDGYDSGVLLGPREFSWRPNAPATLLWAEAINDSEDNENLACDKIMLTQAPFSGLPVEIMRTNNKYRHYSTYWGEHAGLALLCDYNRTDSKWRVSLVNVDEPQQKPRLIWDRLLYNTYENPGEVIFRQLPNGFSVIRQDGDSIFLDGTGSSPDGDRPFLDRFDLKSLKSERLFRSDKSCFETFLAFAESDSQTFLTKRQSLTDHPNIFRRTIQATAAIDAPEGEAIYASKSVAITHFTDATPIVRQIKSRLVKYKRDDGVELSFTLCTPPGYQEGTRVPTILHAYPDDYTNVSFASRVSGSQVSFTDIFLHKLLLLAGYAMICDTSFPTISTPKICYDTYLEQLVANAKAAVDEVVRLGVADPDRIGVTGESHGGLMVANLLAHTEFFRAGIALNGAYNNTLSPFGFQNEERTYWEAPDVYQKVSPFFIADKIKTPLLLMHGMEDSNPCTTPFQSSKFYEAIRGNGGTTRLVLFPHESHWYKAIESVEHCAYEMVQWFDEHVKNAE